MEHPSITITDWVKPQTEIRLNDKFIVIDFWATWCAPCLAALPKLNKICTLFKDRKDLVFISLSDERPDIINKVLPKFKFFSSIVSDTTGSTLKAFHIRALPTVCLINKSGELKWTGPPDLLTEDLILKFLNEQSIPLLNSRGTKETTADSLSTAYNRIFSDKSITNYFDCSDPEYHEEGSTLSRLGDGVYNRLQFNAEIETLFSKLLNCSKNQIILPDSLSHKSISFCFKQSNLNETSTGDTILLNLILKKFKMTLKLESEKKMKYVLNITDQEKISQSEEHQNIGLIKEGYSISSDHKIITIHNSSITTLQIALREVLDTEVELTKLFNLENRYNMVIKNNSTAELTKSLKTYGIQIRKKPTILTIFNFK